MYLLLVPNYLLGVLSLRFTLPRSMLLALIKLKLRFRFRISIDSIVPQLEIVKMYLMRWLY
jgi:hypothetical protein